MRIASAIILPAIVFSGCTTTNHRPEAVTKLDFSSPAEFSKALEARWSLAAIQKYCIPERRDNGLYQPPVLMGEVWEGELYVGVQTGFDKIGWSASVKNGKVDDFHLYVKRGQDFWFPEGGSAERLQKRPESSPDFHQPWFIGHK